MTFQNKERKAVAPIIATLLMVAIAVVGGILIFVFAQGFFSGTSDLSSPGTESITIIGYDARDLDDLKSYNGTALTINAAANPDSQLTSGADAVVLYVKNSGAKAITINSIQIFDANHASLETGTWDADTTPAAAGDFGLTTGAGASAGTGATAEDAQDDSIIEGGEIMSIMVRYNGDTVPNGRNLVAKVTTDSGGEATIPIKIGQRQT